MATKKKVNLFDDSEEEDENKPEVKAEVEEKPKEEEKVEVKEVVEEEEEPKQIFQKVLVKAKQEPVVLDEVALDEDEEEYVPKSEPETIVAKAPEVV